MLLKPRAKCSRDLILNCPWFRYLVVSGDVVEDILPGDGLDVLGGAEDGPAQGSALVGSGVKVIEDDLSLVLFDFFHLAQDDSALAFDGLETTRGLCQRGMTRGFKT